MKEKKINLITVAIIVSELLPYLLCSVLVLVTRESVNWFLDGLSQVMGIISLLLIGNIGLKKLGIEKKEEREYIGLYFIASQIGLLAMRIPVDNLLVEVIWNLLIGLLVVIMLIKGVKRRAKIGFKGLLSLIVLLVLGCIGRGVIEALVVFAEYLYVEHVVIKVIEIVLKGLVSGWVIEKAIKRPGIEYIESETKKELIKRSILAIVVIMVSTIGLAGQLPKQTVKNQVMGIIEKRVQAYENYVQAGRIDKAIEEAELALDYINAVKYVCEMDYDSSQLNNAKRERRNIVVMYLMWNKDENYNALEDYLEEDFRLSMAKGLLSHYKDIRNGDYYSKGKIEKTIVWRMIHERDFVNSTLSAEKIAKKSRVFEKKLSKYDALEDNVLVLRTISDIETQGKILDRDIDKILDVAERQPENINMQLLAIQLGSEYVTDDAVHYGRTMECMVRVLEYVETEDLDIEKEQLQNWVITKLMDMAQFGEVIGFLESIEETEDIILLKAYCYYKRDEIENCLETINQLEEGHAHRIYYNTLCEIEKNNKGNKELILENLEKLCNQLQAGDDEQKEQLDTMLYGLMEECHEENVYRTYDELENSFLKDYLDAIGYTLESHKYEEAKVCIERVLQEEPSLVEAKYLAGMIEFELENFDTAKSYILEVVEKKPENLNAQWVLAEIYYLEKDYIKAYETCLVVKELRPYNCIALDRNNIAGFNNKRLEALEQELEKELEKKNSEREG